MKYEIRNTFCNLFAAAVKEYENSGKTTCIIISTADWCHDENIEEWPYIYRDRHTHTYLCACIYSLHIDTVGIGYSSEYIYAGDFGNFDIGISFSYSYT